MFDCTTPTCRGEALCFVLLQRMRDAGCSCTPEYEIEASTARTGSMAYHQPCLRDVWGVCDVAKLYVKLCARSVCCQGVLMLLLGVVWSCGREASVVAGMFVLLPGLTTAGSASSHLEAWRTHTENTRTHTVGRLFEHFALSVSISPPQECRTRLQGNKPSRQG